MRQSPLRRRMVPVVVGLIACAFMPSLVAAQKPVVTVEKLVDAQDVAGQCGADTITSSVTGTIRTTLFFDKDGNLVRRLASFHAHGTFTNTANALSVDFVSAENDLLKVAPDGTGVLSANGLIGKITLPHVGQLTVDVGRLVLFFEDENDADPDVLFEAGQHDFGPFPALCDAIGG